MTRTVAAMVRTVVLGFGLASLAACSSTYSVEVVNRSGRTVEARLVQGGLSGRLLSSGRVGSESAVTLETDEVAPGEPVLLQVAAPQDMDAMPRGIRVRPGRTTAIVQPGGSEDWDGLHVELER